MVLVSCEALSQVFLSDAGLKFVECPAPGDGRMLDDNVSKALRWARGISVIVRQSARYGVNKRAGGPLDQFGSRRCNEGQSYAAKLPTWVVVWCEAERAALGQMREADFRYHQHQAWRKMHDPLGPVGDELLDKVPRRRP